MRIRRMVWLAVLAVATTGNTLPSATLHDAGAAAAHDLIGTWSDVPAAAGLTWEQLFALHAH